MSCSITTEFKCTIMFQKGLTPLHLATKKSFVKVVELLVSAGAKIGSPDQAVSFNIICANWELYMWRTILLNHDLRE